MDNDNLQASDYDSPMSKKLQADSHYYWFLVLMLVSLSALGSFVNDMYTPSLPAMCRFFHCSIPTVQMVDATIDSGVDQHACGILEGCSREEAIAPNTDFGDTE